MKIFAPLIALTYLLSLPSTLNAQTAVGSTHSGQKTGQPPFPVSEYKELPNPVPTDPELWKGRTEPVMGWGSTNIRYKKEVPVSGKEVSNKISLPAWRGERVAAQFVVSAFITPLHLSYEVSDLSLQGNASKKISNSEIFTGFVRYVMTDELNKDGKGGCGHRVAADFDSTLVADPIDHLTRDLLVPERTTQGGFVRVWVPQSAAPGTYTGNLVLRHGQEVLETLELEVEVKEHLLPKPADWEFHLDLWQNPFAVARYYGVEPWSSEHFQHLKENMQPFADAGGKVITASIMHKPWNGQTHDYFETMVTWMKKADGTWEFDYTVFDKWVNFMMELGVDQQINCYSMVPWRLSFQYFDQASNSLKFIETQPGEKEYEELWLAMLTSFSAHLKEKGWFEKTYISMDERPMETMKKTIEVIRKADKDFKISFAGGMHEELLPDIADYCTTLDEPFPDEALQRRQEQGKISTYYTSCSQAYPNSFTFSAPADNEWYGWYAASRGLDGYLRWAYNSWVLEPLLDSRFITWAAGDTYFVYPEGRSSLRYEKLVQGIQAYEKIRLLKDRFEKNGDKRSLRKLNKALKLFDPNTLEKVPATEAVVKAKAILNSF